MYRIVIWPDSRIPDIQQIEQGRILDIRLFNIARYRISGQISGIGFAGYPALKYQISGRNMPDIQPEIARYPAVIVKNLFLVLNYNKISYTLSNRITAITEITE